MDDRDGGRRGRCRPIYVKLSREELGRLADRSKRLADQAAPRAAPRKPNDKARVKLKGVTIEVGRAGSDGQFEVTCVDGPPWASCATLYLAFIDLINEATDWGRPPRERSRGIPR
jgi:hypothetical protein